MAYDIFLFASCRGHPTHFWQNMSSGAQLIIHFHLQESASTERWNNSGQNDADPKKEVATKVSESGEYAMILLFRIHSPKISRSIPPVLIAALFEAIPIAGLLPASFVCFAHPASAPDPTESYGVEPTNFFTMQIVADNQSVSVHRRP